MNEQIRLLNVSERIFQKYKLFIKGNQNTDLETCKKKLMRNFILGTEVMNDYNNQYIIRKFGKLYIHVDMDKFQIINIENRKKINKKIYINPRDKEDLNKLLGLES